MIRYRSIDSFRQEDAEFRGNSVDDSRRERVFDRFADRGDDVFGEGFGESVVNGGGDYIAEGDVDCIMD